MSVISSSKFLSCLTWERFTVGERDVGSLLSKAGQNARRLCRIVFTLRERLCTYTPDELDLCLTVHHQLGKVIYGGPVPVAVRSKA